MLQPSREYLGVLKELSECRDNKSFNAIQAKLKHVMGRESRRMVAEGRFIERYKRGEATCHLHAFGKGGFNLCAVLFANDGSGMVAVNNGIESHLSFPFCGMQISMFVDIREYGESPQLGRTIPTVIRLQTLDECERCLTDTGKRIDEVVVGQRKIVRNRRIPFSGYFSEQGELTAFLPPGWKLDTASVMLDEIERQVIQGRPHLVEGFSSEDGDIGIRRFGEMQLRLAVRLQGNSSRLCAEIFPNGIVDSINMFRCPDEFKFCGFQTANHSSSVREFKG